MKNSIDFKLKNQTADEMRDRTLAEDALIDKAGLLTVAGFYLEADRVFSSLDTLSLNFRQKTEWYDARQKFLYDYVEDGTWTLDYFMEICKDVTQEHDGITGIDEHDLWACGTEKFNVFAHLVGAGIHVVEKNDSDIPYFTIDTMTERTYSALNKIIEFYNSADVMVADGGKYDGKGYANVWEATVHKAFIESRELFYVCGLINVAGFRDMKDPFGILPMPKTFEEQDDYYHTVSPGNSSYLMLPKGLPDIEDLGLVIEALAMKSQELVTPEFYDMQLKGRDSHDKESEDMLDIIFATRCFDIGISYNWGSIVGCYYSMDNSDIASSFDKVIDAAQLALEDTMEDLEDYEIVLN